MWLRQKRLCVSLLMNVPLNACKELEEAFTELFESKIKSLSDNARINNSVYNGQRSLPEVFFFFFFFFWWHQMAFITHYKFHIQQFTVLNNNLCSLDAGSCCHCRYWTSGTIILNGKVFRWSLLEKRTTSSVKGEHCLYACAWKHFSGDLKMHLC